jgi:hypothetical protein
LIPFVLRSIRPASPEFDFSPRFAPGLFLLLPEGRRKGACLCFQRFIEVWVPLIENDPALFIIIVGGCAVLLTIDLAALVLIAVYLRSAYWVRQNLLQSEEQMPHVPEPA